jgi:hypothetical protein
MSEKHIDTVIPSIAGQDSLIYHFWHGDPVELHQKLSECPLSELNVKNQLGQSLLHQSLLRNDLEAARILLARG